MLTFWFGWPFSGQKINMKMAYTETSGLYKVYIIRHGLPLRSPTVDASPRRSYRKFARHSNKKLFSKKPLREKQSRVRQLETKRFQIKLDTWWKRCVESDWPALKNAEACDKPSRQESSTSTLTALNVTCPFVSSIKQPSQHFCPFCEIFVIYSLLVKLNFVFINNVLSITSDQT